MEGEDTIGTELGSVEVNVVLSGIPLLPQHVHSHFGTENEGSVCTTAEIPCVVVHVFM